MKKFLLCISFYFSCIVAFTQARSIDSLQQLLFQLKDSARIDCLNTISNFYTEIERKDSAGYFAGLALDEAKRSGYINGIAVALTRKARIEKHFDDNFVESEIFSRQSLEWYDKTSNKKGIYDAWSELVYALRSQSRFEEAIYYTQKMYEWGQANKDVLRTAEALESLPSIYKDAGNYEKSFEYSQQFHQLAIKANNKKWISSSLFQMGELYMKINDYRSALSYYRHAFQMDDKDIINERVTGDWDIWVKMEYAEIFSHLCQFDSAWHYFSLYKPSRTDDRYYRIYLVSTGEYYFLRKQYHTALENFLSGLSMHKKLNDRNEIQRTLVFTAKTYLALSNNEAALRCARECLELTRQTKARQIIRDCYQLMYTVYDHWRRQDSANIYFRLYTAINDSVANDQVKAKMAVLNYEEKIELLDKEKKLQQQDLRQTVLQKRLLLAIILAVVVLSLFLVINIIAKRKNEANRRAIAEHALELQQTETEKTKASLQQKATELEMQALRAQMNPHFIFNSLNAINRFILENDKSRASAYLTKFSRLVRLILQNSQAPFITLESELESLRLYLELEALRFDHHFTYTINVEKNLDISAIKVPPLIIQPYAENAIWHGLMHKEEKGTLIIELCLQNKLLCCRITDNGIGRKKAAALKSKSAASHKSMGMQITASRISIMGRQYQQNAQINIADLELADGTACGTEVLLQIPVHYD
ncbi:MAG: histidine kinase [Bacteroidota bacterium]